MRSRGGRRGCKEGRTRKEIRERERGAGIGIGWDGKQKQEQQSDEERMVRKGMG